MTTIDDCKQFAEGQRWLDKFARCYEACGEKRISEVAGGKE